MADISESELDTILIEFGQSCMLKEKSFGKHRTNAEQALTELIENRMIEYQSQLLADYQEDMKTKMLDIIGEDEKGEMTSVPCPDLQEGCLVSHSEFKMTYRIKHRNELKAELRAKVREME